MKDCLVNQRFVVARHEPLIETGTRDDLPVAVDERVKVAVWQVKEERASVEDITSPKQLRFSVEKTNGI